MRLISAMFVTGALASVAMAQFPHTHGAGVLYSHHNFYNASWNTGPNAKPNEVCGVCHIPHVEGRAADRTNQTLLWARQLSSGTYTMYTSPTIDGTSDPQPSGTSRLCLGCHDGSVALEMFHTGTTGTTFITGGKLVPGRAGFDMGSDHPISITYATSDPGLRPTSSPFGPSGGTIADYLEGGKVQCKTCHDVHNQDIAWIPGSATTSMNDYLRMTRNDPANPSALCFACHVK